MVVNTSDHDNQPLELNKEDTCDQGMDELERCAESLIHRSSGQIFKRFIILPSSPFSMERTQTSARVSGTSSLISAIITRIISPGMPCPRGPGAPKGLVGQLEKGICSLVQYPWMGARLVSENTLQHVYICMNIHMESCILKHSKDNAVSTIFFSFSIQNNNLVNALHK